MKIQTKSMLQFTIIHNHRFIIIHLIFLVIGVQMVKTVQYSFQSSVDRFLNRATVVFCQGPDLISSAHETTVKDLITSAQETTFNNRPFHPPPSTYLVPLPRNRRRYSCNERRTCCLEASSTCHPCRASSKVMWSGNFVIGSESGSRMEFRKSRNRFKSHSSTRARYLVRQTCFTTHDWTSLRKR